MTIRAVLDTNVVVSALLWHGTPHALLSQMREGALTFISSPALQVELTQVIARPQFETILARSNTSCERAPAEVRALAEVIAAPPLAKPICRDLDDDAVLALALAANADLIVSGDHDLLDLNLFQGIEIVTPAAALRIVVAQA